MNATCNDTGVPIEPKKSEGPATTITILGIELGHCCPGNSSSAGQVKPAEVSSPVLEGKESMQKARIAIPDRNLIPC